MKYFISTLNFSPLVKEKITDIIPRMIEGGIKHIELSSFHPSEDDLDNKLIRFANQYNIEFLPHNFVAT